MAYCRVKDLTRQTWCCEKDDIYRVRLYLSDPKEDHVGCQQGGEGELQHCPQKVVGVETVAVLLRVQKG